MSNFSRLPTDWPPPGHLTTRQWLLERGQPRHALDNALKSGRLVAPARGLLTRPESPLTWQGVAASLDRMSPHPVYVGGLSALAQAGLGHYVARVTPIHLYSRTAPPGWLSRLPSNVAWHWHLTKRLWQDDTVLAQYSLREQPQEGGWPWRMASPEQAILEVLLDVPGQVTFEHADNLMQGLSALSPRRLDALLKVCRHVQVKRLFFFFADRHHYPWRQHLTPTDYDLGKGKRNIVTGGRLDKRYLITVPAAFHDERLFEESFHGQE